MQDKFIFIFWGVDTRKYLSQAGERKGIGRDFVADVLFMLYTPVKEIPILSLHKPLSVLHIQVHASKSCSLFDKIIFR
jgi:hypothetical protein